MASFRSRVSRPLLSGIVGLATTMAAVAEPALATTSFTVISSSEAAKAASSGRWKVLDVRPVPPLDYVSGHLPAAVHLSEQAFRGPNGRLPFQIWGAGDTASLLSRAGISNADSVLVYSDGTNVLGAALVAYILEKNGIQKVAFVDGGLSGYKAAGSPLTKTFTPFSPGRFKPTTVAGLAISLNELLPLVGRPDVVIVDPRPKAQFEGTDQSFIRNGHIPGAKNITWQSVTEANNADETKKNAHQFKSTEALRNLFVSRGVTPDKTVVVSCSTGREASLPYLVLKHVLKYPNVRIYEGSWTEYSASRAPIAVGPEGSPAQISSR